MDNVKQTKSNLVSIGCSAWDSLIESKEAELIKEIIEVNVDFATFMEVKTIKAAGLRGGEYQNIYQSSFFPQDYLVMSKDPVIVTGLIWHKAEQLKYHSDWNWLMQVAERIEELGFIVHIMNNAVFIEGTTAEHIKAMTSLGKKTWIVSSTEIFDYTGPRPTKTQAAYLTLHKFIQWYNTWTKQLA